MRYIILRKPSDIKSPAKLREIESHMNAGIKAKDLRLHLFFVGSDEVITDIMNEFRKITNRIAFNKDLAACKY